MVPYLAALWRMGMVWEKFELKSGVDLGENGFSVEELVCLTSVQKEGYRSIL